MAKRFRRTRTVYVKPRRRRFSRLRSRFGRKKTRGPISIIKTGAAIAPALIAGNAAWQRAGGDPMKLVSTAAQQGGIVDELIYNYTGAHAFGGGGWDGAVMTRNLTMWIGAYAASWMASKMGANKAMARVPLIGKWIKL